MLRHDGITVIEVAAMPIRLEHANVSVRDIKGMIHFLQTAFPEFRLRGEGTSQDGTHWVHVGTDETYIALSESRLEPGNFRPYSGVPGVNHLAYVVDDVEALRQRLTAAGYTDSTPPNAHPHRKRQYFYDLEGNDWEFVQYLSSDPAERNDYKLPDR
jgi:catechol 2,3-dioxygenase-like lactoylglutathione lyase family enzyme